MTATTDAQTTSPLQKAASSNSDSTEDTLQEHHDHQRHPQDEEKASANRHLPPANDNATLTSKPESSPSASEPPHPIPFKPPTPPNGGLSAWLHVLGGFSLFFNTWGILNTFGIYQTYYEAGTLFRETSSNIAWIGSIQAYMVLFIGFLSGPIFDRGYFRELLVVGSFGVVFGHMMLSLCTNFWQVLLAQGFCVGIGAGCLFVPCVAILPTYWSTKLGLAVGLAAAGSSMGGVIYPIVFYRLIDQIGFAWSTRVIGFIALATLLVPISVMKMRFKPPRARALIDLTAFTDAPFMMCVIASMTGFIGLYVVFFYLSYYAQEQAILSTTMSFYIVPIFNGASTFGRTLPNALSDKTGPINLITPGALITAVLIFCMLAVSSSAAGIIIVAIMFGFFSGLYIALPPVIFVAFTKDKSKIGTRIGMGFGMLGFGVLLGGPAGGAILGDEPGNLNWTWIWVYAAVTVLVSGAIFAVLRVWQGGARLKVKI